MSGFAAVQGSRFNAAYAAVQGSRSENYELGVSPLNFELGVSPLNFELDEVR